MPSPSSALPFPSAETLRAAAAARAFIEGLYASHRSSAAAAAAAESRPSDKHQREASPAPPAATSAAGDDNEDFRDNDGDLFATARDLLDLPRLSEEAEGGDEGGSGGERRGEKTPRGEAAPPAAPSGGGRVDNRRAARPSLSDYAHVAVIGRGAFGEVRLVRELKNGGRLAALKSLDKAEMLRRRQVAHVRAERDALATLRALGGEGRRRRRRRKRRQRGGGGEDGGKDGPGEGESEDDGNSDGDDTSGGESGDDGDDDDASSHVVALRASFQDERRLHLVMEYLPGGDLMTLLMRMDVLPVDWARFYAAETVLALEAVHSLGVVHRDVKPDNLLLDARGHLKLSDFGLCTPVGAARRGGGEWAAGGDGGEEGRGGGGGERAAAAAALGCGGGGAAAAGAHQQQQQQQQPTRRELAFSTVGTPDYIAPEVLLRAGGGYGPEADWWSLGAVLFEMLCGAPPFAADDAAETVRRAVAWRAWLRLPGEEGEGEGGGGGQGAAPAPLDPDAADLIRRLLCDAGDRIGSRGGAAEVKAHPFFAGKGVDWRRLRRQRAPHVPALLHEADTQNFDDFDEEGDGEGGEGGGGAGSSRGASWRARGRGGAGGGTLTSRQQRRWARADPHFAGYTFRPGDAVPASVAASRAAAASAAASSAAAAAAAADAAAKGDARSVAVRGEGQGAQKKKGGAPASAAAAVEVVASSSTPKAPSSSSSSSQPPPLKGLDAVARAFAAAAVSSSKPSKR